MLKKCSLFFALFIFYAVSCSATIGLPETPVLSIVVSPFDSEIVYTGNGAGIYKSINSENIWASVNTGLDSTYVYDLVPDPGSAVRLYAATEDGAYITENSGSSWTVSGLADYQVYSLCTYAGTAATNLAAGTSAGVFTSIDNGTTWTATATGPSEVYTLVIDPSDNETLYAGSFGSGIYKSADFARTWSKIAGSPSFVRHLEIDPSTPSILFAATNSGVYKSTDSGATWTVTGAAFSGSSAYSLAIDPDDPGIVYAATDNGTFRTANSGSSWSEIAVDTSITGTDNPFIRELAIDPDTPTTIYGGTYTGDIYRLTGSGSTWFQMNRELSNTTALSLFFDPESTETVYAATSTLGIIKSINTGESWAEANEGITSYHINKVSGLPDGSALYAGSLNGLFLSEDSGVTWDPAGPSNEVYSFGIDNNTEDNFFLGSHNGVYSSLADGTVWTAKNNGLDFPLVSCIALDPDDADTLYVGTEEDGIYKSTTAGDSWEEINTGLDYHEILDLVISPDDTETLYAGTAGGIFITEDSGATWELLSGDLDNTTITAIEIFSSDTSILYAGTKNKGIYRSTDNGSSWAVGSTALSDSSVYDLKIIPDGTQTLLLAMAGDIKTIRFNTPPAAPASPSPADKAVQQQISMTLSWTGSDPDPDDTLTYDLYFEPESLFSKGVNTLLVSGLTRPVYTLPSLLKPFKNYRWRVVAKDGNGEETQSPVWTFRTNSLPGFCIAEILLLIESRQSLDILREFRDRVLQKTPSGRAIIDLYYKLSPFLVSQVEKDPVIEEKYRNILISILPLIEGLLPAGINEKPAD